ncbi:hypothetical protein [Saccharicrinis fermentans]|uniref:Uncharacterized protein n=1 Tax=Saccharicrinis fermentans DSM 9555 = JCM 21142 TaxID=869213 RepID=W7YET6_9BACT|nr:hypothetical protein [Saccharicrinis fermentans]GAF05983.1 hypothetical protein JCM21142_134749 [Saccharicrinis fermentans DSM 9555 = JCM 21142]
MQEEPIKNTRNPNTIEQFIIERCARNIRIFHIEAFIFFGACDIALWYLTILFFSESFLMGLGMLILALGIGIFLILIWAVIKDTKTKSYQIISTKGAWSVNFEGQGKNYHPVSRVNDEKICMVVPGMATAPKYGEIKKIEYEYVNILNFAVFGYNNIFISIDKIGFSEKHQTYVENLKPIGLLSVVISIVFCFSLMFCFLIEFDSIWLSFLCLFSFFIFVRTTVIWVGNNNLRKSLTIEVP